MELIFYNKINKSSRIKVQIIIHLGENNTSEKNVKEKVFKKSLKVNREIT
jgi:hypothetical protein